MRTVNFDITGKCNLNCIHCSTEEPIPGIDRLRNDPQNSDWKNAFRILKKIGIEYIHLLGGEPTIRNDLQEIVKCASTNSLRIGMNTNGTLLTKKMLESLVEAGITRITLSIDGPNKWSHNYIRGENTFSKAINAARLIAELRKNDNTKISFAIQSTLTKLWINNIPDIFKICEEFSADELIIKKIACSGRARKHMADLDFDDNQFFSAAEVICLCASRSKTHVNFPFPPLVIAYFNQVLKINNSRSPLLCEGAENIFHCFPTGEFFPCVPYAEHYSDLKRAPNIFNNNEESILLNCEFFNTFKKEIRNNMDLSNNFDPCGNCPFFKNICTPCPLMGYKHDRVKMPLCTIVEQNIK